MLDTMTDSFPFSNRQSFTESPAQTAVNRGIAELRRGQPVLLIDTDGNAGLAAAVETMNTPLEETFHLAVTSWRASVLGFVLPEGDGLSKNAAVEIQPADGRPFDAATIQYLADPGAEATDVPLTSMTARPMPLNSIATGAVLLTKLARLLPAALIRPLKETEKDAWPALALLNVADIIAYPKQSAASLSISTEASVPLEGAEQARLVAFRPSDGGIEHLAIVIGTPDTSKPVLVRLHSECFTGDLLGSLRCDCGEQLRGAIAAIGKSGSGVLLYLAQEGRGIGLVNKLRAYRLQDRGFDTLDANNQLGFDDDERIYDPAVRMLSLLGISRVRLLTNNPQKVEGLTRHGIAVVERVPHVFPSNRHNEFYLQTKANRAGHLF